MKICQISKHLVILTARKFLRLKYSRESISIEQKGDVNVIKENINASTVLLNIYYDRVQVLDTVGPLVFVIELQVLRTDHMRYQGMVSSPARAKR